MFVLLTFLAVTDGDYTVISNFSFYLLRYVYYMCTMSIIN